MPIRQRKQWDQLSKRYRQALLRNGISKEMHERGCNLSIVNDRPWMRVASTTAYYEMYELLNSNTGKVRSSAKALYCVQCTRIHQKSESRTRIAVHASFVCASCYIRIDTESESIGDFTRRKHGNPRNELEYNNVRKARKGRLFTL